MLEEISVSTTLRLQFRQSDYGPGPLSEVTGD